MIIVWSSTDILSLKINFYGICRTSNFSMRESAYFAIYTLHEQAVKTTPDENHVDDMLVQWMHHSETTLWPTRHLEAYSCKGIA